MADRKSRRSGRRDSVDGTDRRGQVPSETSVLQRLVRLQALAIIILLVNSALLFAILLESTSQPAVLTVVSEGQVVLDIDQVVGDNITYDVYVDLRNTGGEIAYLSATGEVLVSLYGSAYGEEVQTVLNYVSASIAPGESRQLALGSFATSPGWHYVVQVHVAWNGGTLELSRLVT